MKRFLIVIAAMGIGLFGTVRFTVASDVSIKEYPDHYVVEVDGSMDANAAPARQTGHAVSPAARQPVAVPQTQTAPAAPVADSSAAAPPVAMAAPPSNPMAQTEGYRARLQARQPDQIAARMAARQARWAKYRKTPTLQ